MNTTKLFGTGIIATFALATTLLLTPALAQTETPDTGTRMSQFMTQLQGAWSATGMVTFYNPYGASQKLRYSMDMSVYPTQDSTWQATMQTVTENGELRRNNVEFKIQGERLFIGDNFAREAVELLDSSPTKLAYRITRIDHAGHEIHYVFQSEINEHGTLIGHNQIETQDGVIQEDDFIAKQVQGTPLE